MAEVRVLSEEEYKLWEKAFLAALTGDCARPNYVQSIKHTAENADLALVQMVARNPRFHRDGSPYR